MGRESIAIVGRNGMGKTTLCNAIMGISPPRTSGSIRFERHELVGVQSHKIARRGLGYVPQGRRLFPSLTVDEHLRIASRGASSNGGSEWTRERVYDLFPRLAERKRNGGAQLSGGEQQMLAIGRALVTNPKLLVMDEPSEGLAPAVIEGLIETFRILEEDGLAILLIEQNLGVATALAERQLVMIGGRDRGRDDGDELVERPETCSASTSASSPSLTRLPLAVLDPVVSALRRSSLLVTAFVGCGCGGGDSAARSRVRQHAGRRLRDLRDERRRRAAAAADEARSRPVVARRAVLPDRARVVSRRSEDRVLRAGAAGRSTSTS